MCDLSINPSYHQAGVSLKVGALLPVEVLALLGGDADDVVDLGLRDVLHADKFKCEQVTYMHTPIFCIGRRFYISP